MIVIAIVHTSHKCKSRTVQMILLIPKLELRNSHFVQRNTTFAHHTLLGTVRNLLLSGGCVWGGGGGGQNSRAMQILLKLTQMSENENQSSTRRMCEKERPEGEEA